MLCVHVTPLLTWHALQGAVKLADFGCSRNVTGLMSGELKTMQGTPFWMAPEVPLHPHCAVC